MEKDRQSYRHPNWDYRHPGSYFITICTYNRCCIFGEVREGEAIPSKLGQIVEREWFATPAHREYVELCSHVLMPNHFHGLLRIMKPGFKPEVLNGRRPVVKPKSLGAIVRSIKSAVTYSARRELGWTGKIWQPRFHDRIVRNQHEWGRIAGYIQRNPLMWERDRENPDCSEEDEFYSWLDGLPSEDESRPSA